MCPLSRATPNGRNGCRSMYEEYRAKIRTGEKGKTAQFWIGYMDKAWLLTRFLRATKAKDLTLHMACLHEMCPFFFSQEKPNYARYTSVYLNILLNFSHTHIKCSSGTKRMFLTQNYKGHTKAMAGVYKVTDWNTNGPRNKCCPKNRWT